MNEYRLLIDEIQRMVNAPSADDSNVRHLAAEYQLACDQTNDRLRQCEELMRLGMRSEAIRQAERDPNLLKLANVLDLPELSPWHALLSHCGIDAACSVLVDVAAELEEAYSKEQILAETMCKHRKLALGRAPLRERIHLLRQIANHDRDCEFWEDDLREYQTARLAQIPIEAGNAARKNDLKTVESVYKEITGNGWLVKPADMTAQQVSRLWNEQRLRHAEVEVPKLVPALIDALERSDAGEGRRLRERWLEYEEILNSQLDDDLVDQVQPALIWLDELDHVETEEAAFTEAVAHLRNVLAADHTRQQLEKAYKSVSDYPWPLPEDLSSLYQKRLSRFTMVAWLKRILVVGGLLTLLIGLVAITTLILNVRRTNAQVEHVTSQLQEFIERNDFETGQQLIDDLSEAIASRLSGELKSFRFARQQYQFDTYYSEKQSKLESAASAIGEKLELVTGNADVDEQRSAFDGLSQEFDDLKDRLQGHDLTDEQRRWVENFEDRQRDILARISQLHRDIDFLTHFELAKTNLVTRNIDQAKTAIVRCEQLSRTTGQEESVADLWERYGVKAETSVGDQLNSMVGNPDEFAIALGTLQRTLGKSRFADHLEAAKDERRLWQTLLSYNQIVEEWSQRKLPDTVVDADKWLERLRTLPSESPTPTQCKEFVATVKNHLDCIKARVDSNNKQQVELLREKLSEPHIRGLLRVKTKDKNRYYYSRTEPEFFSDRAGNKRYQFPSLTGFGITDVDPVTLYAPDDELHEANRVLATSDWELAHHSRLARLIRRQLDRGDLRWDERFGGITQLLLDDSKSGEAEPLVRLELLREVVLTASKGSYAWKSSLEPVVAMVQYPPVDLRAKWMSLENVDHVERVNLESREATKLLDKIKNLWPMVVETWKTIHQQFRNPVRDRYSWIGWIGHNEKGLKLNLAKPSESGELFVFNLDGDGGVISRTIGTITPDKKIAPAEMRQPVHLYGRPVFLRTSSS